MEIPSDHSLMVDLSLKFLVVYFNPKKKKYLLLQILTLFPFS